MTGVGTAFARLKRMHCNGLGGNNTIKYACAYSYGQVTLAVELGFLQQEAKHASTG